MTLVGLVVAASERLKRAGVSFGHGTANAFDEAAWLVTWALGLPLDALESQGKRQVGAEEEAKVDALLARRIETRKPTAYLTGEAWLQDIPFTIDERAIVPRSYIAELLVDVEETGTLDAWLSDRTRHVLDLCTGNGSLAVLAAMVYPEVVVDASDVSADALEIARINVARHGLGERIRLVESDLFAKLPGRYDLILCNPPYVSDASMAALPAEYRAEPALALAGGADGMDLVRRIVAEAPAHMADDAVLVLEIGHERAPLRAGVSASRMRVAGDERRRRSRRPDRAARACRRGERDLGRRDSRSRSAGASCRRDIAAVVAVPTAQVALSGRRSIGRAAQPARWRRRGRARARSRGRRRRAPCARSVRPSGRSRPRRRCGARATACRRPSSARARAKARRAAADAARPSGRVRRRPSAARRRSSSRRAGANARRAAGRRRRSGAGERRARPRRPARRRARGSRGRSSWRTDVGPPAPGRGRARRCSTVVASGGISASSRKTRP